MREKLGKILAVISGWGFFLALFLGGLSFLGFIIAVIIGGGTDGTGQQIAMFIRWQYLPVLIRIASISVILGLICMYLNKQEALSLRVDKANVDKEISESKLEAESETKV